MVGNFPPLHLLLVLVEHLKKTGGVELLFGGVEWSGVEWSR